MKRPRGKKSRSRSEKAQQRQQREGAPRSSSNDRRQPSRGQALTGRIQKNPRGFAFIIPTETGREDAYVGPREAVALMNDDIVEYTVVSRGRRQEARIERVLKRGQREILGEVRDNRGKLVLA